LHYHGLQLSPLAAVNAVTANTPPDAHPSLGDEHFIPGLQWGEERARARVGAGLDAAFPLLSGFLRIRTRAGTAVAELHDATSSRWLAGAQGALVWTTPLGMVDIGYGVATTGDGRLDISVGGEF